jgi:hypothetical protein
MAISTIKQFNIFHPLGKKLNNACRLDIGFGFIGSIKAENYVRSFYESQNDFNPAYQEFRVRSTCVGDVISDGKTVHMVMGSGFKKINSKHDLYKYIKHMHKDIPDIMGLTDNDVDELIENSY